MKKRGLCITCDQKAACVLPSKFPVIYCEEFEVAKTKKEKGK